MQIDKGIPAPVRSPRSSFEFPFDEMDVGDSFLVPITAARALRNAATRYAKLNPEWDYTTKLVGKDGVRLWRI